MQINYLELMIELYTKIFHMIMMLDARDTEGTADLRIIPLGALASIVRKMKDIYRRFDSFMDTFSNIDKDTSRTVRDWANFCSIVSDILETVISRQRHTGSKDDSFHDIAFIESYQHSQFIPLIEICSKGHPEGTIVKVLHFSVKE